MSSRVVLPFADVRGEDRVAGQTELIAKLSIVMGGTWPVFDNLEDLIEVCIFVRTGIKQHTSFAMSGAESNVVVECTVSLRLIQRRQFSASPRSCLLFTWCQNGLDTVGLVNIQTKGCFSTSSRMDAEDHREQT